MKTDGNCISWSSADNSWGVSRDAYWKCREQNMPCNLTPAPEIQHLFPKRQTSSCPCLCDTCFLFGFPHRLLPFKFLKKNFYQFPVFKHWAEITKISQLSVYVHGSIPSTGCSENSPVSWSEQLRNWAQSPFDQRMISLVWKHQRNSEGYHITVW